MKCWVAECSADGVHAFYSASWGPTAPSRYLCHAHAAEAADGRLPWEQAQKSRAQDTRWVCCVRGCTVEAAWTIRYGEARGSFAHACHEHLGDLCLAPHDPSMRGVLVWPITEGPA